MALVTEGQRPTPRRSLRELHQILDDSFTIRQVAEPLASCTTTDEAATVRKLMEELHFDAIGLRENGLVTGYVRREDLKSGPCRNYLRNFGPAEIVANTTPLVRCLPLLATRPRVFVLEHAEINGLASRADLQKPPVRMLLFGLVSLLEMHLVDMVRVCCPTAVLEARPGLDEARRLWRTRVQRNEDIDLAECLSLSDKHALLLGVPGFIDHFHLGSARDAERYGKEVEALRNKLAHAQDLVKGSSWERMIRAVLRLEEFLTCYDEAEDEFRQKFGPSS